MRVIVCIMFGFVEMAFGQVKSLNTISGRVQFDSTPVEMVNVYNKSAKNLTTSDRKGMFTIEVKTGDTVVFYGNNLELFQKCITGKDLEENSLVINMSVKKINLKEVVVNQYSGITAESLGIIPKGQKKYTPAERKLYTAQSASVDAVLNLFSGRTAMLEKELLIEKKELLYTKIKYLFPEKFYIDELKIPKDYIEGFKLYCIDDLEFVSALNSTEKAMTVFLITKLASEYVKTI